MRVAVRSLVSAAIVAGVVIACGSSNESTFGSADDADGGAGGGSPEQPTGSLVNGGDSSTTSPTCTPKTCADLGANCGPVGDGCGGIVQCGTCNTAGEVCGGGGVPSVCGKPACAPKTCTDLGANCGAAGDGCGGIIASCGTCNTGAGEFCGGAGPSKCGTGTDGGVGDGGAGTCTPKTCTDLGVNCGQQGDGCGGLIDCGTCNAGAGETCGGGGVPSVCGKACTPLTKCPQGLNCGPIADGCGGIVSCGGACPTGQSCGGGGQSNVCGGNGQTCTNLCTQQTTCPGGGTTSISGTVTSPNGLLPIYGALVYIPNGTVQPFTTGVSCEQCGASASGAPLVTTTTGPDGKFLLPNVPVSSTANGKVNAIPVVIQLGRWRKQFTVQTTSCQNTVVPAAKTALPKNKSEGDIPLTAISTGNVDGLECVFRKLGISDSEFTDPSGNGRIRLYKDNGAVITSQVATCSISGGSCNNPGSACTGTCSSNGNNCNNIGGSCNKGKGTCKDNGTCTLVSGTPPASKLYNDPNELAKYDMTLFECVGGQQDKTVTQQQNVRDYANKGGRVYATHYSYVWLYNTGAAPWNATASWAPEQNSWNSVTATLDTSFSKGQAFAQWLNIVGGLQAPLPAPNPPWNPPPRITIQEARHDVDMPVTSPAQRWLYTTTTETPNISSLQHYTFNTDWTKPADQQCGRVLFSDFHVSTGSSTNDVVFPNECDTNPLTAQEKVLAFMLFDLASCVTTSTAPATCTPKTCADQGIECGQAGDGCGNIITCPTCPNGTTCGGGGTPSKCGKPSCTPQACPNGTCGTVADGCGGTVTCPACANGTTCGGGGTTGVCGSGSTCTKLTCGSYPAGTCGTQADGCGGTVSCACAGGAPCVNGKCGAPTCTPRTCTQAGANCGQVADGCGGLLDCGTCLSPQVCGGGGIPNICGGGVN